MSCWVVMESEHSSQAAPAHFGRLLLAIDTCGPTGSVALGRLAGRDLEVLGHVELEGRSYSTSLIAAVESLLTEAGVGLKDLGGIVAVNGPGSFTGVRLGVAAVKGLAEAGAAGAEIPVVAVSRLDVLSRKAAVPSAALDAHRDEVYLRVERVGAAPRELLAGVRELAEIDPAPLRVAVCDDAAAARISASWPATQLVRVTAPLAKDALRMGEARLVVGAHVDLALLDGHYLRRSDAEIFGDTRAGGGKTRMSDPAPSFAAGVRIRRMTPSDLDRVIGLASGLHGAPQWSRAVYTLAIDRNATPPRIALVAEELPTETVLGFAVAMVLQPESELETIAVAAAGQRRGVGRSLFAALAADLSAAGATDVHLEVRSSNAQALAFYAALGFEETGRRPRYYTDPVEDALLLRLRLPETHAR